MSTKDNPPAVGSYGIDWNNVNLDSPSESSHINAETVTAQFEIDLQSRISEARDIFRMNLKNIVRHAKKEREE